MKFKVKIRDLDHPNANGCIYPKEVLEKFEGMEVPVTVIDVGKSPSREPVGSCRVSVKNYPEMDISDMTVTEPYESLLKEGAIELGITGSALMKKDGTITHYTLQSVGLTTKSCQSVKIQEESEE